MNCHRPIVAISFAAFVAPICQAQSGPATFEAATIKPHDPNSPVSAGTSSSLGALRTIGTLHSLMESAYSLPDYQISGGPSWVNTERFEVQARAATAAPRDQMMLMLQSLLTDRFKLQIHHETRELPVYALVAAKNGPKLRQIDDNKPGGMSAGKGMLRGQMTLTDLARYLSPSADRPVLDRTGLKGAFQIDLHWSPNVTADAAVPSLFTAIQEQLGLKLEPSNGALDIVVIDYAQRPSPD